MGHQVVYLAQELPIASTGVAVKFGCSGGRSRPLKREEFSENTDAIQYPYHSPRVYP